MEDLEQRVVQLEQQMALVVTTLTTVQEALEASADAQAALNELLGVAVDREPVGPPPVGF